MLKEPCFWHAYCKLHKSISKSIRVSVKHIFPEVVVLCMGQLKASYMVYLHQKWPCCLVVSGLLVELLLHTFNVCLFCLFTF